MGLVVAARLERVGPRLRRETLVAATRGWCCNRSAASSAAVVRVFTFEAECGGHKQPECRVFLLAQGLGQVLSSCLEYSSFGVRQGIARGGRSGSDGLFGDLIPYLESDGQFGAVVGGSHPVPGWAEVRRDPAEHCEESLC